MIHRTRLALARAGALAGCGAIALAATDENPAATGEVYGMVRRG
jgi:hypothetical protein